MLCQDGHTAGADLIGGVAVGGHPVAAYEAGLDPAVFHNDGGHVVADEGHVHAALLQLVAGEAGPLEQGPGLVGEHPQLHALFRRQQEGPLGGAVAGGGQRAGVAVGQHAVSVLQKAQSICGDGFALGYVVFMDLHRLFVQGFQHRLPALRPVGPGGLQLNVQRPAEVHRRGAGAVEIAAVRFQLFQKAVHVRGVDGPGQGIQAVGGADADGRGAPDPQQADGVVHLLRRLQADLCFLGGQQGLVKDIQGLRRLIIADVLHRSFHHRSPLHPDDVAVLPGLRRGHRSLRIA